MAETKPTRLCIMCGQRDTHPRHHLLGQEPHHMDCGALTGCDECTQQIAEANGAQGDELYAHLRSLTPRVPQVTQEG